METLSTLLSQMTPWHWLSLALALLVIEIVSGSTYFLWPASAAAATGAVQLAVPIDWTAQWLMFAFVTLALILVARPMVVSAWAKTPAADDLNNPMQSLIGARGLAAGDFVDGLGRVRLGDTEWRAQSESPVLAGQAVRVEAVDGVTLKVRTV